MRIRYTPPIPYYKNGKYTVKAGDNYWNIAKELGMNYRDLMLYNNAKNSNLQIGQVLNFPQEDTPEQQYIDIVLRLQLEDVYNKSDLQAIQHADHSGNYVILDKKNGTLTVYDKRNKELYKTSAISTGASGDDYNTVTYVDSDGDIKNYAGNNSTPAGMYEVSGRGTYHGYPSFTRRRVGSDGKGIEGDDIASSFHYGNVSNKKASNGCVRVGGEELNELRKYMTEGTMTYTLPEKEGSRFVLRGGKLNFVADNPYGNTTGDKKYWDDYNTTVNKEYKSLLIAPNEETGNAEYDGNVIKACNAIGVNKRAIQKKLGLSSDEYNRIAQLAMGILEQESKYGTAIRYKAKQALVGMFGTLPQQLGHVGRWMVSGFKAPHKVGSSVGIGQIKAEDDFKNEGLANLYNWAKIDRASDFESPDKGALAVMLRLGYIYNTEVKGRSFKKRGGQDMDKYDALLYAYNGRSKHARNGNAKPEKSEYLNNVKNNSKRFTYLESNDE